jgi:nucleotide-binding universal stress UspA family protein
MGKLEVQRILIPTDFSDTANLALEHAVKMAKLLDSEITLLHVVSTFSFRVNLPEIDLDEAQNAKLSGAIGARLAEYAEDIKQKHGIKVNTLITYGRIREEVVRVAEDTDADIIILGTHGVSGIREFFMGSNAFRIVSEASCPVLSVQQSAQQVGFNHIVVPIDNSFHSREKLGMAVRMAATYDSTIHICGLRSHDHDDEDINAKFRMKMKQVEDFLKEREVNYTATTVFCSNIARATMDFGIEKEADLIIIMNEQEINTTGFFMGPYAQQIVNHSTIPVLSIRPTSGFVNSVTPY